jgi:hypothetical protein
MINKPMMEIKRKTFTQEFVHKKMYSKKVEYIDYNKYRKNT